MKQHRNHTTSECNKATQQQIEEACQGINNSGSLADMYIGLTITSLNRAVEKRELISQVRLAERCTTDCCSVDPLIFFTFPLGTWRDSSRHRHCVLFSLKLSGIIF